MVKEPLFIVCDGVGGSSKGEVASSFVAESFCAESIDKNLEPTTEPSVNSVLVEIQNQLQSRLTENKDEAGMGTTFTMAYKHSNGLTLAHIGDSRIYYLKPRKSLYWHTKDHSLVHQLLEGGHITKDESLNHPMRNRITRAIQANLESDFAKADVATISTIERGDLLFLCTDGVLEAFSSTNLLEVLLDINTSLETKYKIITAKCDEHSKDNNTFVLVEFDEEDAIEAKALENDVAFNCYGETPAKSLIERLSRRFLIMLTLAVVALALLVLMRYYS